MKKFLVVSVLLLALAISAFSQDVEHEYADIVQKDLEYKDWTYKNVLTDEEVNLREFTKDKKLVLIFYFASWCHNSEYQLPLTQKLYEKYKDQGLAVIGVSLYAEEYQVNQKLEKEKITFPVVVETTSKFRTETPHYKYRTAVGDTRKWGTPWNVFLTPSELNKEGDVLTAKPFIVNGEIKEKDGEKFIREKLGVSDKKNKKDKKADTKTAAKKIEACEEDSKTIVQKVGKN